MQNEIQNLTSKEAWNLLEEKDVYLVDVRTPQEWKNIGVPNPSQFNKKTLQITLRNEDMSMNENFLVDLKQSIPNKDVNIIFICKAGGRSAIAASLAMQVGYKNCSNIIDGFEGNSYGIGWKQNTLPHY